MTLERVAEHAEVSKGGLLYHFANKGQLLVALLENTLARTDDDLEGLAASNGRATGSFAKAYLDYVRSDNEAHLDSAAGIFAAAALDDGDLTPAQSMFEKWQNRLLETDGLDPTLALLVRVVGDGLWLIDLFGLAAPSDTQRADLCDLVEQLLDR